MQWMITAGAVLHGDANMSTVYVLMEAGWEYDDNIHWLSGSGGGNPQKVFEDKEKAETEATRKNLEDFKDLVKSGDIREYGYNLDDMLSDTATEDDLFFEEGIFRTLFGKPADDWWRELYEKGSQLKVEPTEMQWIRLMHCFNLYFYDVVAVEKG